MGGDVSVFNVEATGFGVGKETLNSPSLSIEAQCIFGSGDIRGDQKQFATPDFSPFETQSIFRRTLHATKPARPFSLAPFAQQRAKLKRPPIFGFDVHVLTQSNDEWNIFFNEIRHPPVTDELPVVITHPPLALKALA